MKNEVSHHLNEFFSTHLTAETLRALEKNLVWDGGSGERSNSVKGEEGRETVSDAPRGHQVLTSLWRSINMSLSDTKIDTGKRDEVSGLEVLFAPRARGGCGLTNRRRYRQPAIIFIKTNTHDYRFVSV